MRLGELNQRKLFGVETGLIKRMPGVAARSDLCSQSGPIVYGGEADLWSQLSQPWPNRSTSRSWRRGCLRCSRQPRLTASGGASGRSSSKILQSKKDPDFHLFPIGRRVWDFVWEVLLPGQGDPRAAAGGHRACAGLLGVLRLCAGHAEPLRDGFRAWVSRSGGTRWAVLFLLCRGVCGGLRGGHLRAVCAAISWCGPNGWARSRGNRA